MVCVCVFGAGGIGGWLAGALLEATSGKLGSRRRSVQIGPAGICLFARLPDGESQTATSVKLCQIVVAARSAQTSRIGSCQVGPDWKLSDWGRQIVFDYPGKAVELVVIARGAHGAAIRDHGLEVRLRDGDNVKIAKFASHKFRIYASVAEAFALEAGRVDFAVLAVKTWQVEEAALAVKPLLAPEGCVVTTQNGLEAPEQAAASVGPTRVLGGTCHVNCWVAEPGVIEMIGGNIPRLFTFGEVYKRDGSILYSSDMEPSARAGELAATFAGSGTTAAVAEHGAWREIWAKAGYTSCLGPVSALARAPIPVLCSVPETRVMLKAAMLEWAHCRVAAGHHFPKSASPEAVVEQMLEALASTPPGMTTSTQRDVILGKPSELRELTGSIQRAGIALKVPTPTHDFIYAALLPQERRARDEQVYQLNGIPGGVPHVQSKL